MTAQLTQEQESSSRTPLNSERREDGIAKKMKVQKLLSRPERNTIKNSTHSPNSLMKMIPQRKGMGIEEIEEEDIKDTKSKHITIKTLIKQFLKENLIS